MSKTIKQEKMLENYMEVRKRWEKYMEQLNTDNWADQRTEIENCIETKISEGEISSINSELPRLKSVRYR